MRTTGHLDYLSITFPMGTSCEEFTPITGDWVVGIGNYHGYQRRRTSESGATWDDMGSVAQGSHLTLKGKQLEYMRDDRSDDLELIANVFRLRGKASRVDLTVNIFEASLTVRGLWQQWLDGQAHSAAQQSKEYFAPEGQGTDDGFYLGAETSDRRLRIYNKGRQLGETEAQVRLELQCRKLVAKSHMVALNEGNSVREVINKAILNHTQFYDPQYLEALADNDATIDPVKRRQPDFWKWVEFQLVPSFVKRQQMFKDENVLDEIGRMFDAATTQSPDETA